MMEKKNKRHTNSPHTQKEFTSLHERAILASMADGVIAGDVEGRVTVLNQAAARMLGVDTQTTLGHPVRALFEPFPTRGPLTTVDVMDRLYADPYTDGRGAGLAEVIIAPGTRVIQAHLSPVLTEVGEFLGIVIALRDITREVEAERARSELVLDVSHELGAPLTAIKGYSEMLLRYASGQLEEQHEHFLRIIQRNSDRLVALVNDLLDISRVVSNQLELDLRPIQMETLIRDVASTIQPQCDQKGLRLEIEVEPNVGLVLGDENRLRQVVANLASNSCHRTPEGGHITLALSCSEGAVRVDVTDTGTGIPLEDQAKVFQRFYRLKAPTVSKVKGTGLELPIAKMLVEMHGGRMWVESGPGHRPIGADAPMGQGSAFTFLLPLYIEAAGSAPDEKAEHPGPGRTVLVVEDDEDTLQLIALQLSQEGFEVLMAKEGKEALRLAHTQDVDLITLDIMLPDITGMDVLRQLKADSETADIPVIIVSVLQPDVGADEASIADHITKPFALERLVDSIRRTLTSQ